MTASTTPPLTLVPRRIARGALWCATVLALTGLGGLPRVAHAVGSFDSDGDGAADASDVAPCDASYAGVSFFPSETDLALLAFEDQWPLGTDLDFNDVVVRAHYRLEHDAAGRVRRVLLTVDPVALGGRFDNGLGLVLPAARDGVTIRRRLGEGAWSSVPLEADSQVTARLSGNLRELFDDTAGQINAGTADAISGQRLTVEIGFAAAVTLSTAQAPFDLFIFRSGDFAHQIHFPQYAGTAAMNTGLFGSSEDGSTETRKFVHTSGIPAALNLMTAAYYPLEARAISDLFPDIMTFASSAGTQAQGFYLTNVHGAAGLNVELDELTAAAAPDQACLLQPLPIADALSPTSVMNPTTAQTVTITGSAFVESSVVTFNGTNLATTFGSSSQLTAVIPANLIASSGSYTLRVVTPAPGGGTSASFTFTVLHYTQSAALPSCEAVRADGGTGNGIYLLDPDGAGGDAAFQAYCDQTTDGGGWMLTLYAPGPVTSTAYDLTMGQIMIRGEALKTATSDPVARPVAPNGYTKQYGQVLFRGGDAAWVSTMGAWVRMSTFPLGTTAPSTAYDGVLTANGRSAAYHQRRAWSDATIPATYPFSLWDANGVSSMCGGASVPNAKHCPHFAQEQAGYPYHYDTSTTREVFVRGPLANATPVLTSISPSGVLVGTGATSLTVTGSAFVRGAVIVLDGSALTTSYVSATSLMATLPATTFTAAGTHTIAVRNPAPGGGASGNQTLAVGTLGSPGFAATSCVDIYNAGTRTNGRYNVVINGSAVQVYCDMTVDGGGWMQVLYAAGTVTAAHDYTMAQIAIRGNALRTATTDATNRPVLPTGLVNNYSQVLFRGGNSTWVGTMGSWVRFSTFANATSVSATFAGVRTSNARTAAYHNVRGWGSTTVAAGDTFSLWDANGISGICGGANTAVGKNCPYFNQVHAGYPYHYDTASAPRELFVR